MPKPRGTRLGSPNKSNPLKVNGVSFTQVEVNWLKEYCTVRVPPNSGGTMYTICIKVKRAYPNCKMPTRMMLFRFAYGEGIVKL